ncbi:unnamed protein product [Closterium sp. NIES-53]
MASLRVLSFDPEGRPVAFDTWHDDLQLYLLSDLKDSVTLFGHVSGAAPAPPATADVSTRSQWLSRDATAHLAIRNHLPATECAHFGEHRTSQALYDAVVARYSSPATAAIGRLLLPYLFPELSAFATIADLVTHLSTSDARYRTAVLAEFLPTNQPPMFITLYFIVTRLPDSLRSIRDHFLTLDPTSLTVDLLEQHLLAAETSAVATSLFLRTLVLLRLVRSAATARARVAGVVEEAAVAVEVAVGVVVGAAVEEVEAVEVVAAVGLVAAVEALVAAVEAAEGVAAVEAVGPVVVSLDLSVEALVVVGTSTSSVGARPRRPSSSRRCFARLDDAWHAEFGDDVERPRWAQLLQSGVAIFDLDFDVIVSAMYALSFSAEGDCYQCVPPDPGIAATALGASASRTPPGTAPAEALHNFTLDSGASRCFFCDSTTLTPLPAPVPVRLADPSGGPVVASSSTVLPCPAVPSGSLSDLHPPSFSTNLVSTAALQDAMVTTTSPGGQRVSICTCTGTGRHLATSGSRLLLVSPPLGPDSSLAPPPGSPLPATPSWHALPSPCLWSLPPLPPSPAPPCLPCVEGQQRAAPHSSFPPTSAPLQTLHMDVWGPARISGQGRERNFLLVLDDYTRYTTVFPLRSKGESQPPLQPAPPLPAPSPYTEQSGGLTERREPASRPVLPVRTARRAPRSRPPPILSTHAMALRPSSVPLRVPLPAPPESSLPEVPDPESDRARAASPTVARLLATAVTDPFFESAAASALVAELLDFASACRLDYATALLAESVSASPPSVGGECALGTDVLEDRQKAFECLAAAVPRFASMLLALKGDSDAPDIPTLRSYVEAITGPYSSEWQAAMDAEMASWKSAGTYVDEVPPPGANIVDGMWIFRVKQSPCSPPAFKARYVARGFSQRQGVDYFQTFSPTPKMTTLRVLLHVAAQRDYELHFLDFSTAFLQGSLHEDIFLRRPVYGPRQAPREWHDTLRTTLTALGFAPSTTDTPLFLRTDTSLPPFYALVYVDDLVFATADSEALTLVKSELQKRHICTDVGELRGYLGLQITRDRARRTITLTQSHMVNQVLQRFGFQYSSPQLTPLSTSHTLSAPPSDESVEPSGPYPEFVGCLMYLMTCTRPDLVYPLSLLAHYVAPGRHRKVHWDAAKRVLHYLCSTSGMGLVLGGPGPVVLTSHADASWVDDSAMQRSSQGYTFSLGSGSVSWRSTRSSSVLSSSCEVEIYAGAMAAQELRWLTYLLTDLGEQPRSPPLLYVDNKAMIALCQDHSLEHRTKHIALRYFLARELQHRGQLRLAYVATRANTADVFTKALPPGDHRRFVTVLGLVPTLPHLLTA